MINILVTSAGTASAINVIKSLKLQKEFDVKIYAVDIDITAPGLYLADAFCIVPRNNSPDYLPVIIEYCKKEDISVIFPIHSSDIKIFADNCTEISRNNIKMLIPPSDAINICNDKKNMCRCVKEAGINAPLTIDIHDKNLAFPLIAKPNNKSGSQDIFKIVDDTDLTYAKTKFGDHLFQEWIDGVEVTVDCLFDKNSNLIVGSPRKRLVTKAGQCVKGITFQSSLIFSYCKTIGKMINFVGPANIQFIIQNEIPYFIEMNPRFAAGGLMLTTHAGANIPQMILEILENDAFVPSPEIIEGLIMTRYYEEFYISEQNKNNEQR
jgi:carbamoyl-phosphate synthase large subunit